MLSRSIYGVNVFYYPSDDPVINALTQHSILFGEGNFKLLREFINTDKGRIIDCGSHVGTFAVPAALDSFDVTCIEGAPKNIECLNKTSYQFDDFDVFENILSDKVGKCSFSTDSGPFGMLIEDADGEYVSQTLDNICKDNNYDDICGIKYDLEGGEIEALIGSRETLDTFKPPLLVEVNGWCLFGRGLLPENLFDTIEESGYEIYVPFQQSLFKVSKDKVFPFCVIDVVCLHKESLDSFSYLSSGVARAVGVAREFTDDEIGTLLTHNYNNSNCDCKKYFESIK